MANQIQGYQIVLTGEHLIFAAKACIMEAKRIEKSMELLESQEEQYNTRIESLKQFGNLISSLDLQPGEDVEISGRNI